MPAPVQLNFVHKTGYETTMYFDYVRPRSGFEVLNELDIYAVAGPEFTLTNEAD